MPADPFASLRRAYTPRRPRPEFAAMLRQSLEGDLPMSINANQLVDVVPIPKMVHIGVADADRAMQFFGALFDWEAERVEYMGHVRHYVTNTSIVGPVLTDERGTAFVRLGFTVLDTREAATQIEALGGHVDSSEIADDGGGWVQGDDGQRVALVVWRPGAAHPHDPPSGPASAELGYFSIHVPDPARGAAFYREFLGWPFELPTADGYYHVDDHVQPVAMGVGPGEPDVALTFGVDDLDAAIEKVRALGGEAGEPHILGPMLRSECRDDQGTPFAIAVLRPV